MTTLASKTPAIIGLDLARATGFVVRSPGGALIRHGEINYDNTPFTSPDRNGFTHFNERFKDLFDDVYWNVSRHVIVAYEDVQFMTSRAQTNIWSGLRALVYINLIYDWPVYPLPVSTIKKYATGKGNATKQMMFDALPTKRLQKMLTTDNMVDAWWVSELARDQYTKGTFE